MYEYAPFAYIADSRQNAEYLDKIYSKEYRARQKFINYMRDKYA